jgi:hypothetical protein
MIPGSNIWPFTQEELDTAVAHLQSKGWETRQLQAASSSIVQASARFVRAHDKYSAVTEKTDELYQMLNDTSFEGDEAGELISEEIKNKLAVFSFLFGRTNKISCHKRGPKIKQNGKQDLIYLLAHICMSHWVDTEWTYFEKSKNGLSVKWRAIQNYSKPNDKDWQFIEDCLAPLLRLGLWKRQEDYSSHAAANAFKNDLKNQYKAAVKKRSANN